jgi:simple sugar transport system permease protein
MTTTTVSDSAAPKPKSPLRGGQLLRRRPELASLVGAIIVFVFFSVVAGEPFYSADGIATWLLPAAELGIIAVPVALLMISGEFDLSVGSTVGAAGMIVAVGVTEFNLPGTIAVLIAFGVALAIGWVNGMLVVKTGLPSFIVTLASLFLIAGCTVGLSKTFTGSTIISLNGEQENFWATRFLVSTVGGFSVEILWWIAITALGIWILARTPFGNSLLSTGGNLTAARNLGIGVNKTRIALFMSTSAAACMVGVMQALTFGSGDTTRGFQTEFQVIIAAVIGGCLLTGGYGSALGAALGALTFGMAQRGIPFAGWDTTWFQAFLGGVLLLAVLINLYVNKRSRRGS